MKRLKRILAIAAVVIIAAMFIITIFVGIFMDRFYFRIFMYCLAVSCKVPIVIYLIFWMYRVFGRNDRLKQYEKHEERAFSEAKIINTGQTGSVPEGRNDGDVTDDGPHGDIDE